MMNRLMAVVLVLVMGASLGAVRAHASGFALPEQGAAAMGMSGAFTGQADDVTAVWYNPAALTGLEGTWMSGGVVGIYPSMKHENAAGTEEATARKIHTPIHLYAAGKAGDNLSWGFGINNPFGLSTDWSATGSTRFIATFSEVVTINLNPNIALKVNDSLSLALGLDYILLDATMNKILPPPVPGTPEFKLTGDGEGVGANLAVLYKASDITNVGLSYRSRMEVDVDGTAEIASGALARSNPASTKITLPDVAALGVSYKVSDALIVNGNLDYTFWSTYDRLVITSNTLIPLTGGSDTKVEEKQWEDTWCFRVGGQYKLSEQVKLRAGLLYDQNPVPEKYFETRVPDADRMGLSLGVGFASGAMVVDASYMYLKFDKRNIGESDADILGVTDTDSLNGTYTSEAHLLGVTVAYKF